MVYKRKQRDQNKVLTRAKNIVRGSLGDDKSNLAESIVDAIKTVPASDIEIFLDWVASYPATKRRIRPLQITKDYGDLWPSRNSIPVIDNFTQSARWVCSYLNNNIEKVVQFIEFLDKYESYILTGDLPSALLTVEKIDSEIGYSNWAIEAKIALLQKLDGLEAQKKFVASIRESAPDSLPAFIAAYTSERNEQNISLTRFSNKMKRIISRQKINDHVKKYLTLRILGLRGDDTTIEDISQAMCVASSLSIIDSYEGFIWACQTIVANGLAENLTSTLTINLSGLDVRDWRICKLKSFLSQDFSNIPCRNLEADTLLIQGDFQLSFEKSLDQLDNIPDDIDSLANASAALAYGGLSLPTTRPENLLTDPMLLLAKVIAKEEGVARAANDFLIFTLNFRSLRLSEALYEHLIIEWGEPLQTGDTGGRSVFICSPYLNPLHWRFLPHAAARSLLIHLSSELTPCLTLDVCNALCSGAGELPSTVAKEVGLFHLAHSYIYRQDYIRATRQLEKLEGSPNHLWQRVAAKTRIRCLLATNNTEGAIYQTVQYCCDQDDFRYILPIRTILAGVRWRQVKHLKADLAVPIVFDLYWRTIGENEHDTNRRIAYDEFLLAHNCRRPTELRKLVSEFEKKQLVYFLSNVCVQEVMDVSFDVYKSSREIEEERIAVCIWISELRPDLEPLFSEEIVAITKILNIQDGIRDVDSSRIYVDLEAISRWAKNELMENFLRYKTLLEAGFGFGSPEKFDAALKELVMGNKNAVDDYLTYPDNDGDTLLIEMLGSLSDEYLTNSDYGLNAYLSMRIRHGSLAGHLRGPLEEQSLVVPKDIDGKKYLDNDSWVVKLQPISKVEECSLITIFAEFSEKYDRIITQLVEDKLQIRTNDKPAGMFYLSLNQNAIMLHYIRGRIQHDTNFDDFLELVFMLIHILLQSRLDEIRQLIVNDVKHDVNSAVDDMRSQLNESLNQTSYAIVNSTIADVVPEVQAAIDRVSSWFTPQETEHGSGVRTIDQIVDIGIEATKQARRGFSPIVKKEVVDVDVSTAGFLSLFTDIMFTILDNVHAHSGNSHSPWINIKVGTNMSDNDDGEQLTIRVESEVSEGTYSEDGVNKISRIQRQMDSGDYKRRVNLEGGTGLLKLKRLVSTDHNQSLKFGFSNREAFFVELKLSYITAA